MNNTYNLEDDNSIYQIGQNRKTKLTLAGIHKLRKIREGRKISLLLDQEIDSIMYSNFEDDEESI